jgi:hypothetical protein
MMPIRAYCTSAVVVTLTVALLTTTATAQEQEEQGTQTTAVGVTVTVKADAWSGQPAELTEVIPLLVTIENNSRVPVRLRYAEFSLAGDGERGSALPPFEITGTETEPIGTTGLIDGPYPFPLRGFYVAPHYSRFYPRLRVFPGPFAYDPLFYSRRFPVFRRFQLPTGDMVQKALPEGVLEPGGRVTGFLYFEDIDVGKDDRATFVTDLVNASNGETVDAIRIPLEID